MTARRLALGGIVLLALVQQGCAPAVLAGAGTAVTAAHDRRTVGAFVDDAAVEIKGRATILQDDTFKPDVNISITSMNGIVLVSGEAATEQLRDRVLGVIRSIPGIRQVVNEIRIASPTSFASRTFDSWVTTKVKAQMAGTQGLDATRVKVVTENQTVFLLGLVTRREAELATEAARAVSGVERVVKLFEYLD